MLHSLILRKRLIQFQKNIYIVANPIKNGIKGKLYRSVKSMFDDGKARVRCAKFCDFISCIREVKQADAFSPVLFSLYINDLPLEIINNSRHDATLNPDFHRTIHNAFLFETLLSETLVGLQT